MIVGLTRLSTLVGMAALAAIPVCILIDLVWRHLGIRLVIGLESIEYLLLVSVVCALPGLSLHGDHIALNLRSRCGAIHRWMVAFAVASIYTTTGLTCAWLALRALAAGARFRRGFDVPEAPVWGLAAFAFLLSAGCELSRLARGRP